jgi:hypothetical protein
LWKSQQDNGVIWNRIEDLLPAAQTRDLSKCRMVGGHKGGAPSFLAQLLCLNISDLGKKEGDLANVFIEES